MVSILWLAGAIEYESVSKKKKNQRRLQNKRRGRFEHKEGNWRKNKGKGCLTSHWTVRAHTRCLSLLCGFSCGFTDC